MLGPGKRWGVGPAAMGQQAGSSAPGTVSLGAGLGAYLAWDSAVVCAALPETPAVACDASDQLVLIGEVHLPDQGPVTKNPHFSASTSTATVEAERVWIAACLTRYRLRLAQALIAAIPGWWRKAYWDLKFEVRFLALFRSTLFYFLA